MADDAKGFWQSAPGMLTGAAAVIAAITGLVVALKPVQAVSTSHADVTIPVDPTHAGPSPSPAPPVPTPVVQNVPQSPAQMGPLEFSVGYEGNDLHPKGTLLLGSAQACANRCYEALDCKAMTYIRSTRRCWLKSAAGNRAEANDEVSAVKR